MVCCLRTRASEIGVAVVTGRPSGRELSFISFRCSF